MSLDAFAQVQKVSHREQVGAALRAAIVSGAMEPGVVYSAPSLSARFGVSATPVREAMIDLTREGLVETVVNKGYRVTEIAERDLDEICELRLLLEPPVVAKVTPAIPDADLPELRRLAGEIVDRAAEGKLVEYTEADRAFHLRLLSYSGNARLINLVADLRAHTRLYGLSELMQDGQLEAVAREHLVIVDTIATRDQRAVEKIMRRHISQVRGRWAGRQPRPTGSHA